jgi:hypothetical protein
MCYVHRESHGRAEHSHFEDVVTARLANVAKGPSAG